MFYVNNVHKYKTRIYITPGVKTSQKVKEKNGRKEINIISTFLFFLLSVLYIFFAIIFSIIFTLGLRDKQFVQLQHGTTKAKSGTRTSSTITRKIYS